MSKEITSYDEELEERARELSLFLIKQGCLERFKQNLLKDFDYKSVDHEHGNDVIKNYMDMSYHQPKSEYIFYAFGWSRMTDTPYAARMWSKVDDRWRDYCMSTRLGRRLALLDLI